MAIEGVNNVSSQAIDIYNRLIATLPVQVQGFVNIALLVVLVTIFCIFIWKVYHIISKKNLIDLNLRQYNQTEHPAGGKFLGTLLYFVEYIIILPFLVIFWFFVFTFFLLLMTKGLEVPTVLLISTVIIVAIRATSYYREKLSRDLAKLLPFTLLAVAMTEKGFFDFQEILGRFSQLPLFFNEILSYMAIIVIIEVILRTFDFIFSLFDLEDQIPEEDEQEDEI